MKNGNKLSKKTKIILGIVIAVLVVWIFNPVSLFRIKKWTLNQCATVYSHFYKDEINDENLVCGIPKSDMIGKNANEIDKKYNVVLEKIRRQRKSCRQIL